MRAIVAEPFGGPETLRLVDRPTPAAGAGELLVRVRATALNRADLLQRMGKYPPPQGVTDILGLEMAGIVEAVGAGVDGWRVGDRVCALLPGGGYAEYAVIPAGMAMAIPEPLSFEEAAAIPEAFLTAYLNLWRLGGLQPGHRVLVHAAASGVGTAAIQLVREAGAASYATAGTAAKLEAALSLGAAAAWNYRDGSFRDWLLERTNGAGVDVALDFVGAPYFADHLATLAVDGRLVVIGTLGGAAIPGGFSLGTLLARRLHIIGTTLRSRPVADKISLTQDFAAFALPRFADGRLRPIVDAVFPFEEAAEAHRRMESNVNIGKIVLRV
ncbi:NAD(P)H-quinone oxidoreductase [Paenibacillus sp.]|uniref:NAD(P)H-quinone oxidoreductase n=1 Tax=Paenibacillus sp. TaxID=58172 RepID=UPI0028124EA8|nr:NAD(P)H-quinone oxidoreductase [Paenibacillus sp.]